MKMLLSVSCVLALAALSSASSSHESTTVPPPLYSIIKPLCDPLDLPPVCKAKKSQCSFITSALSPPGGYIKTFIDCARTMGVALGPVFFTGIGGAYQTGTPEGLGDLTSPDPTIMISIRRCAINATGLVFPDMSLDRISIANALEVASGGSPQGLATAAAAATCHEAPLYKMAEYMSCLKDVCAQNAILPTPAPVSVPTLGKVPSP